MSAPRARSRADLRRERRRRRPPCYDHLLLAPLWPMHDANLGTLLRTCDAIGACMVIPHTASAALHRGNTLRRGGCVHRVHDPLNWLTAQRGAGTTVVGVELADEAVRLADLPAAHGRTVVVLGAMSATASRRRRWSCSISPWKSQ